MATFSRCRVAGTAARTTSASKSIAVIEEPTRRTTFSSSSGRAWLVATMLRPRSAVRETCSGRAVEVGARAGERGVGLAGQRQVDRGEHRLVLTHEGGGHRPLRQGVQVVDVAFGRIHDPPFAGRQRPAVQFVLHPAGCPGAGA